MTGPGITQVKQIPEPRYSNLIASVKPTTPNLDAVYAARAGTPSLPACEATLTILGDWKPLLKSTVLRGKDASVPIRLDVKGVKKLTIRVGYGPDEIDTADHVDLVAARLIR